MAEDHWRPMFQAWSGLARPVIVPPQAIAAIKAEVADVDGRILLLGTTRDLLDAGRDIVAIDHSHDLVREARRSSAASAIAGNWTAMPFAPETFAASIGDGSFISLDPARLSGVLDEIVRCLSPGGTLVFRVFLRPDVPESVAELMPLAEARRLSFQHFKFKFAMAVAPELGSATTIPVAAIPARFDLEFPDRGELAERTGWDRAEIDTIDLYRSSTSRYSFPSESQFLDALPGDLTLRKIVPVEGHPYGREWPIVVLGTRFP